MALPLQFHRRPFHRPRLQSPARPLSPPPLHPHATLAPHLSQLLHHFRIMLYVRLHQHPLNGMVTSSFLLAQPTGHNACFEGALRHPASISFQSALSIHSMAHKLSTNSVRSHGALLPRGEMDAQSLARTTTSNGETKSDRSLVVLPPVGKNPGPRSSAYDDNERLSQGCAIR